MNTHSPAKGATVHIAQFANSYAALPGHFFVRINPVPVTQPRLIRFNRNLATELGIDVAALGTEALAALLSGNIIPAGAEPIAMVYAGHQFGHFVPQLGDGRAILLGEVRDVTGVGRDIQLKGSGPTPFSRDGDGRAAVGPVLREYLVSEAMHALGVPSTRALAAVTTGEHVHREGMVPGAILTRVAASHVRVGTFEYFAARGDVASVRRLADYVIDRHYAAARNGEQPYLALLQAVMERQAQLIARWMHVGFIHGVMNTDNMAVSGETIDFGPCAFLDTFDPGAVFSSIDGRGRYAYANQPHAAQWNLARFAEALVPVLDPVAERAVALATEVITAFPTRFSRHWLAGMRDKLGLTSTEDGDHALIEELLGLMYRNQADFTLTFRRLCDAVAAGEADQRVRALFSNPPAYDEWARSWRLRLSRDAGNAATRGDAMRRVNPACIPRNHRVEQAIAAAVDHEDFSRFAELLDAVSRPYEESEALAAYTDPPQPGERVLRTFCGT